MAKITFELFNKEFAIIANNKNEMELKNLLEIFKKNYIFLEQSNIWDYNSPIQE